MGDQRLRRDGDLRRGCRPGREDRADPRPAPALKTVIVWTGEAAGAITLDELIAKGEGVDAAELDARSEAVQPEDAYTIIYTSGTTGPPKGCVLTHGNYRAIVSSSIESGLVGGVSTGEARSSTASSRSRTPSRGSCSSP